jgi:hypothetical protein
VISQQAGRALNLIQGIRLTKQAPAEFWIGVVTRIVTDLDEVASERDVTRIADLLAVAWGRLPDRPAETMEAERHTRYPLRIHCPACGRRVLVVLNRSRDLALAMDPEPDGDGEHFDTILAEDLSRVSGATDSAEMLADWKGRFPLYRCHAWSCPENLAVPCGRDVPHIGGYWGRDEQGSAAPLGAGIEDKPEPADPEELARLLREWKARG